MPLTPRWFWSWTATVSLSLLAYILVGSTDLFDGYLARKYNWVTEAGKDFDAVGDLFLYLGSAYFLYVLFTPVITNNALYLYVFFMLLAISLLIPFIRFKKLVMLHTKLLKLGAVLVVSLVVLSFAFDTTYLTRLIIILYCIAFSEEILIFLLYGDVDPDTPSILSLKN